jgi:hypothetical protein
MAYSSLDPTTGAPVFLDADAPDPAVNPTQVAAFAAERGNLLRGTTAEMNAFEYPDEGLYWSSTDDGGLYRYTDGNWDTLIAENSAVEATVASGWGTPSQNVVVRKNGWVMVVFNAAATSVKAVGAVVATVPVGFRANYNVYAQAWGLLGAANTVQVYFESATGQIKMQQGIASGQSIAVTMTWPQSG